MNRSPVQQTRPYKVLKPIVCTAALASKKGLYIPDTEPLIAIAFVSLYVT
jgi:hypothetical protein